MFAMFKCIQHQESDDLYQDLSKAQVLGVKAGLTREQVSYDWFSYGHARAAKQGCAYELYQGLSNWQAFGVSWGLTREQVNHDWFSNEHYHAAKQGCDYELYQGLSNEQVLGVQIGLTRGQVNNDWFDISHYYAAKKGCDYESYQGLSYQQARGIRGGLKRVQVEGLNEEQIDAVKEHSLPEAAIVAGLEGDQLGKAVDDYKFKVRRKAALASLWSPANSDSVQGKARDFDPEILSRIGAFM